MSTTDTNVPQVIVNKLTSAEYAMATKSPTEFYAVTDGQIETADIADGAVTTAKATNDFALVGTTLSTPTNVAYVATANIQDGAVTAAKADFTTYSTTEQMVGKWIDGKPLYRSVLSGTIGTTNGEYPTSSFPSNISKVVKIDAIAYDSNATAHPLLYFNGTTTIRPFVASNRVAVTVSGGTGSFSNCAFSFVIEYTKTTD
jgi:hypothetical protein